MTTTVTIDRLGHLGDGIAEGPVFVARVLPGEVVTGVVKDGRMAAPKIVSPVPERVRPVCRHYKNCGGCSLQHADDAFVETWKKGVVENALAAQGIDAPIRNVTTSPPNSRRRAVLAARRLKNGTQVGFHGLRSDTICEIPDCQLIRPEILAMVPLIRELTIIGGSRKARLAVTVTFLDNGVDILVVGGKPLDRDIASALAAAVGQASGVTRLSWDDEIVAGFSPGQLAMGRANVCPPAGAFLQASKEGEAALIRLVREAVGPAKHVADLFAGCGTFSLPLAQQASVHAVESEAEMLEALAQGWRGAEGLKAVTTEVRDLFRRPLMPDELKAYDALILDPPRAGAEAQIAEIVKADCNRVAMVSCNPVTFARDANVLVDAGFVIQWVDVVDQFRWSPHVELVACLERHT